MLGNIMKTNSQSNELLLSVKTLLLQPLAYRQVIEFIGSIGHKYGKHEDADGDEDVCAERCILMTIHPRHLHVDERIMGDVDRIGNFSQETVDGFRFTALNTAASTHCHYQWETNQDSEGFVEPVGPTSLALST